MCLAIITARLGSKRLKLKNIKNFFGKPVISYPIKACLKSNIFDKVVVSTESKLISRISNKYNAEVPFLRSKKFSDDKTGTSKLMRYLIKKMRIPKNEVVCCVYPVTPLLTPKLLEKSLKIFTTSKCKFLIPIQRANKLDRNKFQLDNKNIIVNNNRTRKYYKDSGQFYFGTADSFLKNKSIIFSGLSKGLIISKNTAVDVNTIEDWNKLKKNYQKLNNKKYA